MIIIYYSISLNSLFINNNNSYYFYDLLKEVTSKLFYNYMMIIT